MEVDFFLSGIVIKVDSMKNEVLCIGLMSGTSADGVDAALVRIKGTGMDMEIHLEGFISTTYETTFRNELLRLAKGDSGGSRDLSRMNFRLGEEMKDAVSILLEKTHTKKEDIDFIGSHGHTFFHEPEKTDYFGKRISSTFQLGESAVLAEAFSGPVVSDFRVSDIAAGGQGAPLVPYTEFLLYGKRGKDYALQNIGGIGNITYIGKNFELEDVFAFDTGPGNMIIDGLMRFFSNGKIAFDDDGALARKGCINFSLLDYLMDDEYLRKPIPKTTGREYYGEEYLEKLIKKAKGMKKEDIIATVTEFTALSIKYAVEHFFPEIPEILVVSGGGASNGFLMERIKKNLSSVDVRKNVFADAKEAMAFAILANERMHDRTNNAVNSTGARHPVVMGKVVLG